MPDKEEANEVPRRRRRSILPIFPAKKTTRGCEAPQATANQDRVSHKSEQPTTEGREAHAKKARTGTRPECSGEGRWRRRGVGDEEESEPGPNRGRTSQRRLAMRPRSCDETTKGWKPTREGH
jgi:hypothetical protein